MGETRAEEFRASDEGHSLFQNAFFFCTVKSVGDIPGGGCIFVETVVDSDTGIAFAKVYSAKSVLNAVDILISRVVPYFKRRASTIREIHTPYLKEYCGLISTHPYEAFLASSRIRHLPANHSGNLYFYLCEQFYSFLLREFLQPALRKTFQLSLGALQKDLDAFLEGYNAMQLKRSEQVQTGIPPSTNFPVDL